MVSIAIAPTGEFGLCPASAASTRTSTRRFRFGTPFLPRTQFCSIKDDWITLNSYK